MLFFNVTIPQAITGLVARCDRSNQAGIARVALGVQAVAVASVENIKSRSIPTRRQQAAYLQSLRIRKTSRAPRALTASNAPLWKRSGNLLTAVKAAPIYSGNTATLTANVPYSGDRHELGISRMPVAPALGIVRADPFFALAASQSNQSNVIRDYVAGFSSAWQGGA